MKTMIIDGEDAVLGRLASFVAKKALRGNEIFIVNSEKVIVVGKKKDVFDRYKDKKDKGGHSQKGPFFPKSPERILKRTIRGMLSYKKAKSRKAFKRIKCFTSIPEKFKDKKMIKSGKGKKGVTLGEIAKKIGGVNE